MRALQKLVRNGSSTQVTMPRPMLVHLGWLPGQAVVIELLEDNSVRIRLPQEQDFAPVRMPRMTIDTAAAVEP